MIKKISVLFMFLLTTLLVVSCDGVGTGEEFTVDFIVDGQSYHRLVHDGNQELVFPDNPTKENFVFGGWYLDKDIWTIELTPIYRITANITVYAKWDEDEVPIDKIYVSFAGDSIEIEPIEIIDGKIEMPIEPIREGYTFAGWYLDETFENQFENDGLTSNVVIHANWAIKTFSVTWKCDDEILLFDENVNWGTLPEYDGNIPTKEGYTFVGWSPELTIIKENQVYVAQFTKDDVEEVVSYTVKFYDYDNTLLKEETVNHGSNATAPENPDNQIGYHFTMWDKDFNIIESDLQVKAIYQINQYLVKFYDYDNTLLKEETVNHGSAATAPENPDNQIGYHFSSWSQSFTSVTSDLVIIAQYEPNPEQIQIIWKNDDGSIILAETISFPTYPVFLGNMPIKEGYKLLGWMRNGVLLTSLFGVTETVELYASWTATFEGFTYRTEFNLTTNRTEASITGYIGVEKELIIPSKIDGLDVTKIAEEAFMLLEVNSVVIPDSVLSIGIRAFSYCHLKQVILPSYLKAIERDTFSNSYITSITIPNDVETIGNSAFRGSTLQEIFFDGGSKLESIGSRAFESSALKSIVIPNSVVIIKEFAFRHCSALNEVTFEEKTVLETIETGAFSGYTKLQTFNMPSSVLSLGAEVFSDYGVKVLSEMRTQPTTWDKNWKSPNAVVIWDFKELIIVDDVMYAITGNNIALVVGFNLNSSITEIVIKNEISGATVSEICAYAFSMTPEIKSISIPNTITYIGENAFSYTDQLVINIDFISEPEGWHVDWNNYGIKINWKQSGEIVVDGIRYLLLNNNEAIVIGTELDDVNLNLVIPSTVNGYNVVSIGTRAFLQNENVVSVFIPSSIRVIGSYAFSRCVNLEEIIFEENSELIIIEMNAFLFCSSLVEIIVPKSVIYIKEEAFLGCRNLETVIYCEDSNLLSIGTSAFSSTGIKVIDLPQSVIEIGAAAFNNCVNLTNVTLPNSITVISSNTFNNCIKLKSIFIPKNVITIGNGAFSFCPSLKLVDFESGSLLATIEREAFAGCGLQSISLGSEVTFIGDGAFRNASLTSITIPNSVSTIEYGIFQSCYNLESVVFESNSNLTIIQPYTFENCRSLRSIEIPASVTMIEIHAFSECINLTSLTFEENSKLTRLMESTYVGVTEIRLPDSMVELKPYSTFMGWSFLEKIFIPATITYLDGASLRNCHYLKEIIVDENNQTYCSVDGVLYYKDLSRLIRYPNSKSEENYDIPDSVLVIGSGAFSNALYLKNITIPQGVIVIESYAFERLQIETITIPNSVVTIGTSAFEICHLLTEVIFEEDSSLEHIGRFAFSYSLLKSIVIPDSVVSIGESAFANCNNLESIIFGDGVTEISKKLFYYCQTLSSVQFGKNVTSIGGEAFYGCLALTKIHISNEITMIGNMAFSFCNNLAEVTFEDDSKLCIIGESAFALTAIRDLTIPESVTDIGERAFNECRDLVTVVFEGDSQLSLISAWLFYGCGNLVSIEFEKSSKITEISEYAFAYCLNLSEFSFPESVVIIGENAFYNCSGLEKIVLDGNITTIGSRAFQACLNLKTVIIGENVTFIDQYVFDAYSDCQFFIEHTRKPAEWHELWAHYVNYYQLYWSTRWHYDLDGNPVPN